MVNLTLICSLTLTMSFLNLISIEEFLSSSGYIRPSMFSNIESLLTYLCLFDVKMTNYFNLCNRE